MPREPHPDRDPQVAANLGLAIEHAIDALDRNLAALRVELRLSPIECSMVRLLARHDWSIGALARASGHGRSSISMAARRLEARGFFACAREGRRSILSLAPHVRRDFLEAYHAPMGAAIASWSGNHPEPVLLAATGLAESIAVRADDLRIDRGHRDLVEQLADAMLRGDHASCFDLARPLVDHSSTTEHRAPPTKRCSMRCTASPTPAAAASVICSTSRSQRRQRAARSIVCTA